jgi:hypothetical protein
MYRDFISSPTCHIYFCDKLKNLLNKPDRPNFIEDFRVTDVKFSEQPPLLSNIQWMPITDESQGNPFYDVVCTADMVFESKLQFSVSTVVWINWPREHFASVPLSLTLEVAEVVGKVRFGVEKGCSFMSFLEEPKTKFNVSSAMGNFNNFPLVSDLVIVALRKHISQKVVHPG